MTLKITEVDTKFRDAPVRLGQRFGMALGITEDGITVWDDSRNH